jgi:hypothetical protein
MIVRLVILSVRGIKGQPMGEPLLVFSGLGKIEVIIPFRFKAKTQQNGRVLHRALAHFVVSLPLNDCCTSQ